MNAVTPFAHADGIYFDLPMDAYVRDRALSGSAFKKLDALAPDYEWEHADNPLWHEPQSKARLLGTLCHKAVLEGMKAFNAAYAVKIEPSNYPHVLRTSDDMKEWLRQNGAKVSGTKDELEQRIRELDPAVEFWDSYCAKHYAGRTEITEADLTYVLLVERFIRSNNRFTALLSGGLAEVSVFWTRIIKGVAVRFKARFDYINLLGVLDLKKFGPAPRAGVPLTAHLLEIAKSYGYQVQAVHNVEAARQLRGLFDAGKVYGGSDDDRATLEQIIPANDRIDFRWLFVRTPGALVAKSLRFSPQVAPEVWARTQQRIDRAIGEYIAFSQHYGDGHWLLASDEEDAVDERWPMSVANVLPANEYEDDESEAAA